MRMLQVCWGEAKISVVKHTVLREVFSSRTSKKQESRTLKTHRVYLSFPLNFGHVFPLPCGYQPLGGFIKHNPVPNFVFMQLFAPLPAEEKELRQLLGGFCCCFWLEGASISTQTHTEQKETGSTGLSLLLVMLPRARCTHRGGNKGEPSSFQNMIREIKQ